MTPLSTVDLHRRDHRASVHQHVALAFVAAISLVGAFPFHLLSAFALGAAIQFRHVVRMFRLLVGAASLGLLAVGLASAVAQL